MKCLIHLLHFILVKHLNLNTGIAIIRAKRGCHLMVQSALTFTTKIKDYNIMIHTLHIGGNHTCTNQNITEYSIELDTIFPHISQHFQKYLMENYMHFC